MSPITRANPIIYGAVLGHSTIIHIAILIKNISGKVISPLKSILLFFLLLVEPPVVLLVVLVHPPPCLVE